MNILYIISSVLFYYLLMGVIYLKLTKLKLQNYRCFGPEEQSIDIDALTAFIGNNSAGKTAALCALNCIFSQNSGDRTLKRSDFHLPLDKQEEDFESQNLYIETVFEFEELQQTGDSGRYSVPTFFQSMVVDGSNSKPYLRIRLEASWEKSNNIEGAIDTRIYYITCPEGTEILESKKQVANRRDLDQIRVLYIPAVRDPAKQLRNASGTIMFQIMNSINWSDTTKTSVKAKIEELNDQFMQENGVSMLGTSIHSQWEAYDSDARYSNANLKFSSTNLEASIKKSEVIFSSIDKNKEYTIDDMGDGLKSLFYISLVDSFLDVEVKIQKEIEEGTQPISFNRRPPILTIIALEEPENHIAPHLIGKLITNFNNIAQKCNAQTVFTSHSPSIVKRIEPTALRYFRMESDNCATRVCRITLPKEEKLSNQYKYIKEAVKAYPEIYFARLVILGEGESEEILLPKFWEAQRKNLDVSGVSIVPLGGRHVNHFWRLLNDLKIPYVTLLDLDREREGGGWGRIKYALEQLLKLGYNRSKLLNTRTGELTEDNLKNMNNWPVGEETCLQSWIAKLENYHVFFSSPLDIDFLMLEHYEDIYKSLLTENEGPRFICEENGIKNQELVINAEKKDFTDSFLKRINNGVNAALKECGGDGSTYTEKQKVLMIWYTYFFLQRGKPTTHIEAVSKMKEEQFISNLPPVFKRLFEDAATLLPGETK